MWFRRQVLCRISHRHSHTRRRCMGREVLSGWAILILYPIHRAAWEFMMASTEVVSRLSQCIAMLITPCLMRQHIVHSRGLHIQQLLVQLLAPAKAVYCKFHVVVEYWTAKMQLGQPLLILLHSTLLTITIKSWWTCVGFVRALSI